MGTAEIITRCQRIQLFVPMSKSFYRDLRDFNFRPYNANNVSADQASNWTLGNSSVWLNVKVFLSRYYEEDEKNYGDVIWNCMTDSIREIL